MINFDDKPKDLVTRIKYKYWEIWPECLRPMTMWYNFKCWVWHRYSTVRSPHLPNTWCDRRELLLYTSFEILTQFIDDECSPGHVEWYGECPHTVIVNGVVENVMDEMKDLYHWWNTLYLKEYPAKMEELWEAAEPHTPEMRCEPYEGMPPNIAGQLVTKWESDEQHDAYSAIHKEIRETEQRIEEQAEEMLKRLAAVRLYMWT